MLTATGIGSGLDIESLVTQLVAAERTPVETRLASQEAKLTAKFSAFGSLKSALSTFQQSLSSLNTISTFLKRTATSSDTEVVTVSAGSKAQPGSYDLAVTRLAQAHSLAMDAVTSATEQIGTGTLTFRFGSTDYTGPEPGPESYNGFTVNPSKATVSITIDETNNTLQGIRDAINAADFGVAAVIVNDAGGARLVLSSQAGAENSVEMTVTGDGDGNNADAAGLSRLAFNSSATHLEQTAAGQNALYSINGLSLSSSENTIVNAIDGVTLTLKAVSATPVKITIDEDRDTIKAALNKFVEGYNSFATTLANLTRYDAETGVAGPLQGDFSARSMGSRIQQLLGTPVKGLDSVYNTLSAIGIRTQADGTIALDESVLDRALDNNFDQVSGLFASVGFPSDNQITFLRSSSATAVGSHGVSITQLATRGTLAAGNITFPLVIDSDNDNLTFVINGTSTGSLSLTQGSYATGSDLALELQLQINSAEALKKAGISVSVTYDDDHFEIVSDKYGSASTVAITTVDTNTTAQLGFSVATGAAGLDVAGTIGGVAATGNGQWLTGAEGSDAEGLQLLISGGAPGDRGSVSFSRGIAYQLNALLDTYLKSDGLLDSRSEGLQERIEGIADSREALNRRLEALEIRYRNQFNALDTLLGQLQSTSEYLTQQLAALPESGSLLKKN